MITKARHSQSGMALFMVMLAVGIATVLAIALLANSSVQSQVGSNMSQATRADLLSESGTNLAAYYLGHPNQAPASSMSGLKYWVGENEIKLGPPTFSTNTGTVSVTVSQQSGNTDAYNVTAVASAPPPGQSVCTIISQMQANYSGLFNAVSSNASLTLPSNCDIRGNVLVNGTLTVNNGASIDGTATAKAAGNNQGNIQGASGVGKNTILTVPAGSINIANASTVQDYRKYLYSSVPNVWRLINAPDLATVAPGYSVGFLNLVIPSLLNPGGVFVANQTVTLNNNATIIGTLIIQNGDLVVVGNNVSVTPNLSTLLGTDQQRYPAIIIMSGNLIMANDNATLNANGVVFIGGAIITDGQVHNSAQINVTGALVFGGNAASISSTAGKLKVIYDASRINCPHFNTQADTVTVTQWQQ